MKAAYRYSVAYFSLFGLILLLSGLWLFGLKIGFTPDAVSAYYLGSAEMFTQPKSTHGLLEIAVPHLGAMGLFIMVSAHFLIFVPKERRRHALALSIALFTTALLNIFAPFAIIAGLHSFIWIKLISLIALQLLGLHLLWVIFSEAFRTLYHHREI